MILERGDMFDVWGKTDVFVITTNPIVTKEGRAVMGRGMAKQIADKHPDIPFHFGSLIRKEGTALKSSGIIGLVGDFPNTVQVLGYFMVKQHWAEAALPHVIAHSVRDMKTWIDQALAYKANARFDLNFPGIGNGKLAREQVLPLIEELPDCVHVWEYGQ